MDIHFWGVRGSIATPLTNNELKVKIDASLRLGIESGLCAEWQVSEFIKKLPWHVQNTVGGDTSCVEIRAGEEVIILDSGTGIRALGLEIMRRYVRKPIEVHIFLSHTHWDHISGFPFFVPAYIPNNRITLYGAYDNLEKLIRHQQDSEYFPVPLDAMSAQINFFTLKKRSSFHIRDIKVENFPLNHPGGCSAYKICYEGKTLVYATDSEYKELSKEGLKPFIEFFKGADLLIFDAQYTLLENVEKEDWGHSNTFIGIDMAYEAGVKAIAFTHHEPTYSDSKLWDIFENAKRYRDLQLGKYDLKLFLAYEGLELKI